MAKLSAKGRRQVKSSNFVYPSKSGSGGSYPIHTRSHATQALRMAARPNTKGSRSTVKAAVCRKYPSMAACRKGK